MFKDPRLSDISRRLEKPETLLPKEHSLLVEEFWSIWKEMNKDAVDELDVPSNMFSNLKLMDPTPGFKEEAISPKLSNVASSSRREISPIPLTPIATLPPAHLPSSFKSGKQERTPSFVFGNSYPMPSSAKNEVKKRWRGPPMITVQRSPTPNEDEEPEEEEEEEESAS